MIALVTEGGVVHRVARGHIYLHSQVITVLEQGER